ncbi:hypothetical protein IVA96_06105 [Bradyrhizobium sp. 159]|uniref:hypothetical protein n=1 Tax=Bradyrhizobium sp. 159 TaxID=2782632 RepID=UPI001FF98496|nr:hypothetical protein [Bradyrhizobium sp. 159]MCK1616239.1 hypothetical protein [Bradyrhizobium sp. 159]
MKKLKVELQHCYGIKSLKEQFDFASASACAVYAPNGAMKSSLAKTFQDIADGKASGDRVFPERPTSRSVVDETDTAIPPECILVVRPYDEVFGHTERTSTLLVNAALREEYERLHVEIDAAKERLLAALKAQSGTKKDIRRHKLASPAQHRWQRQSKLCLPKPVTATTFSTIGCGLTTMICRPNLARGASCGVPLIA